MARIPITEIPNAPQAPMPVLDNVQRRAPNLSGAAANFRMPKIQQGAFDGAARGDQAMGEAFSRAGNIVQDFALRRAEAQNAIDIAQGDLRMREAYATHQQEIQTLPESEWVPSWDKRLQELRKEVMRKDLSPDAQARMEVDFMNFQGRSKIELSTAATKQALQRGRMALYNAAERAELDGDLDKADEFYDQIVSSGLDLPEAVESRKLANYQQRKQDALATELTINPKLVLQETQRAIEAGDDIDLGDGLRIPMGAQQKQALLIQAKRAASQKRGEAIDALQNAIASGDVQTPDDLNGWDGDGMSQYLEPDDLSKFESQLAHGLDAKFQATPTPNDKYAAMSARIGAYDSTADPDGVEYMNLMTEIGAGFRKDDQPLLTQRLRDQAGRTEAKDEPGKQAREVLDAHENALFGAQASRLSGYINRFRSDEEMTPKERQNINEKNRELLEIRTNRANWRRSADEQLNAFMRQNPQATKEQVDAEVSRITGTLRTESDMSDLYPAADDPAMNFQFGVETEPEAGTALFEQINGILEANP